MHGLYLLWWVQERHIPPATVAIALAAGDLALLALEVPTGWFADKCGHRTSLIAGSAMQVLGMLACWLGAGVPAVIAANLLVALGDAFRSGADQALLYRTCAALGREHDFQSLEARSISWRAVGLLVEVLAGGFIVARWGFDAGWLVETCACGTGLGMALAMVEPPPSDHGSSSMRRASHVNEEECPSSVSSPQRARLWLRYLLLIAPAALVATGHSVASFLAQTVSGRGIDEVTWLVATMAAAEAVGAGVATRSVGAGVAGQWWLGVSGVMVLTIGIASPTVLGASAVVLALLDGFALPLRSAAIQSLSDDGMRARVASAANAFDMAVKTIALPLAGRMR